MGDLDNRIQVVIAPRQDAPPPPTQQQRPDDQPIITRTTNWRADETKYNETYTGGVFTGPVYNPRANHPDEPILDAAASKADLSRAAVAAVTRLSEILRHISDDNGYMNTILQVTEIDQDSLMKMDAASISTLFESKILRCVFYKDDIRDDPALDMEIKKKTFSMITVICGLISVLKNIAIGVVEAMRSLPIIIGEVEPPKMTEKDVAARTDMDYEYYNKNGLAYKFVADEIARMGYRRYGDSLMRRVITKEGLLTNAWKRQCTILEFIKELSASSDPENAKIFPIFVGAGGMFEQVAKIFTYTREQRIPWVKPDRHVFAFQNGCYLAKDNVFIPFNKHYLPKMPDGTDIPTACKYHDYFFDPAWLDPEKDWWNIPTPMMDQIMKSQRWCEDVQRVYYAMNGRMIYNVGEMDNWQVFLFALGTAETGKSTMGQFISTFYEPEDVGTIANNIETVFGLSSVASNFIALADDIGESFTLDQMTFQSMASGNTVSLAIKNAKEPLVQKWTTQCMFNGNIYPGFKDNAGSVSRRLLTMNYDFPLLQPDPELSGKLAKEIAAAICKCNLAYRNMVRRVKQVISAGGTFWSAIPQQFELEKFNAAANTNAVANFLRSGKLIYGTFESGICIPMEVFRAAFNTHCTDTSMQKPKWVRTTYMAHFRLMGLTVSYHKSTKKYPRPDGPDVEDFWIHGCDLATHANNALINAGSMTAAETLQRNIMRTMDGGGGQKRPASGPQPGPAAKRGTF